MQKEKRATEKDDLKTDVFNSDGRKEKFWSQIFSFSDYIVWVLNAIN